MVKVLIAIISCHKNVDKRKSLRRTWLQSCATEYKFFLGRGQSHETDELCLDVDDGYDALHDKVRAVLKWALDRNYDFILRLDDDVYLVPDRFLTSGFEQYDYVGRFPEVLGGDQYASGFCIGFSARAAQRLLESPRGEDTADDRLTGHLLLAYADLKVHHEARYFLTQNLLIFPETWTHCWEHEGMDLRTFIALCGLQSNLPMDLVHAGFLEWKQFGTVSKKESIYPLSGVKISSEVTIGPLLDDPADFQISVPTL